MKVIIFRAPESEARPEKFIADRIIAACHSFRLNVVDVSVGLGVDPVNSEQFYDSRTALNSFSNTIRSLESTDIQDGDVLFFIEGMNPCLPIIDWYLESKGKETIKLGIFHSSTMIESDLFHGSELMKSLEEYCLKSLHEVVVATKYLKRQILSNRHARRANISVTGLPYLKANDFVDGFIPDLPRKKQVIFSHRWADDKRKSCFIELAKLNKRKDVEFVVLSPTEIEVKDPIKLLVCKTKAEYFRRLSEGKVIFSCAKLETFGYSALEGIRAGLIPLFPKNYSYPELVQGKYLYNEELIGSPQQLLKRVYKAVDSEYAGFNSILKEGLRDVSPERQIAFSIIEWIKS